MIDWTRQRVVETQGGPYTLAEAAAVLFVSPRWLHQHLETVGPLPKRATGRYAIDDAALASIRASDAYRRHLKRRVSAVERPFVPGSLREYHRFHRLINEFTWLLKSYYTPSDEMKRRHFRLDTLLQDYLTELPDNASIRSLLTSGSGPTRAAALRAEESIRKVWYNELAYSWPVLSDPFLLDAKGVRANLRASSERFAFPSWRITIGYYAVYHAVRAINDVLSVPYRLQEHSSPLRAFKATKLAPATRCLLRFPFNIRYGGAVAGKSRVALFVPTEKRHLRYLYARHPRPPRRAFEQLVGRVTDGFRDGWSRWSESRKQREIFMLPDLLFDLRNWVSYVDINNMLSLQSEGFRAYLDLDLTTILFFFAAFVELAGIAVLGADRVTALADGFFRKFIRNQDILWHRDRCWAFDTRMQLYAHVGRLANLHWEPRDRPRPEVLIPMFRS